MTQKLVISMILNILITVCVAASAVAMLLRGKGALASTGLKMLKFFTVDSNLLMAAASALFAVYDILCLTGRLREIPAWLYVLKLSGTACVSLTMLTVLFFLAPTIEGGLPALLKGANLYLHLLVPLASILVFLTCERTGSLTPAHCAWAVIPVALYECYYLVNALRHLENGRVPREYDWYGFVRGGIGYAYLVIPLMLAVSYGLCVILRAANRVR